MNGRGDWSAGRQRTAMVATQLRSRGIADERVLRAMGELPREWFVGADHREAAYADSALPIDAGQTISQPYMVARMTELLAPRSGERVLEVGTGSGYQAAILALLGCRVVSIERQPELAAVARRRLAAHGFAPMAPDGQDPGADRPGSASEPAPGEVVVRVGDGSLGDGPGAPWDGIIVTAAAPAIPVTLREQLRPDGGRLVVPVGGRQRQDLILVVRNGDQWTERNDGPCVFVPLVGEEGFPD